MVAMLSQKYGANYEYGAGIVSLSTLLSLVSMPIILGIGAAIL
jgi:malate permease and related proteins